MREFTAISLFAGAGGLDMGFERAGFRTIWANDFEADACKTHENWSSAKVVCGDIAKIDASDIPDADIILGGFPCHDQHDEDHAQHHKAHQDLCGIGDHTHELTCSETHRLVIAGSHDHLSSEPAKQHHAEIGAELHYGCHPGHGLFSL